MAKKRPYRFFLYLAVRLAGLPFYGLPRGLALFLGRCLGEVAFIMISRQRENTLRHLRLAFGDEKTPGEIRKIARGVFRHGAETAVDVLRLSRLRGRPIEKIVETGNAFDVYRGLLQEGKGLISVTAHMGNWELLAGVFGLSGFEGAVIARRVYYEPYNRWIVNLRRSAGVETIYREQAARGIFETLRRNQVIGLLPDQDIASQEGVFVKFLGRPAYTPVAPVKIALLTGAPLLPNFLLREKRGRYRLLLGEVIRPRIETTREDALQKYTEAWMKQFEAVIRRWPDQWMWMHNRWKTQPSSVPSDGEELVIKE